jgi:FkbM family methyltransferase
MSVLSIAKQRVRKLVGEQSYAYLVGLKQNSFLRGARGVVHVGANTGQERFLYHLFGLRVVWFEPIREVFETLTRNIAGFPMQRALNYLIAEEDGKEYQFHISNDSGESSSLLELSKHTEMFPDVTFTKTVMEQGITLRTALEKEGIDPAEYDALVLGAQGAEYRILTGTSELLSAFRFAKVVVPDFEAYKDCTRIGDLGAFMSAHGFKEFRRVPAVYKPGLGTYFNVIYRRADERSRNRVERFVGNFRRA